MGRKEKISKHISIKPHPSPELDPFDAAILIMDAVI